ncbi:MAG: hypothetical protein GY861_17510 [bacterium]|nr:hypothetical protein [bacterium]
MAKQQLTKQQQEQAALQEKHEVSKYTVDEEKLKGQTTPNVIVTGGWEEVGLKRIQPIEIEKFLLMHPAIPRGIEIKANRMIKLVDEDLEDNVVINESESEQAKDARDYCKKILGDSGGPLFVKDMAQGAYRFGTSFAVLQTNIGETEVLRFEHQHEMFFGPARYPKPLKGQGIDWGEVPMTVRPGLAGRMKIDPKTKKISAYTQFTKKYPERGASNYKAAPGTYVDTQTNPALKSKSPAPMVPIGKEIKQYQVMQLYFDHMGDEPLGISLVQYLFLTVTYLLNMEKAGAQTMVNFGFNKWKANTPFKDVGKMRAFGKTLSKIQEDAVVILPKDVELDNIVPGQTEFDKIHPIYMKLIAIRLGIPMPLLTQSGTETNKASIVEMRKEMYDDFIADELLLEHAIDDAFFKACQIKWKDLSIAELDKIVPSFEFNNPPEDKDVEQDRDLKFSLSIRNYATAAKDWAQASADTGVIDSIGAKVGALIEKSMTKKELQKAEKEIKQVEDQREKQQAEAVKELEAQPAETPEVPPKVVPPVKKEVPKNGTVKQ